jgi:O-methyltransferase
MTNSVAASAVRLYLDLLKGVLTRTLTDAPKLNPEQQAYRAQGAVWPGEAETMIGVKRLDNLDECITTVLAEGIPGDLMECGVWRGGAAIFMRAALEAHGDPDRSVWLADSFEGVARPDPAAFPEDVGLDLWTWHWLAVPRKDVEANFERYGLLDDRVRFLEGWFRDTLPGAPVESLALLRLDGDLYESTFVALEALYDKVSPGGFVIVDDYLSLEPCRLATDDFRRDSGIEEEIVTIDWTGIYWRKSR